MLNYKMSAIKGKESEAFLGEVEEKIASGTTEVGTKCTNLFTAFYRKI